MTAIVNIYELSEAWVDFKVLCFEIVNEKWLDFVCACRKGQPLNKEYDIIFYPEKFHTFYLIFFIYYKYGIFKLFL